MSRRRLVWTGLVAALIVAALLVWVWPPAHRWVFGPGAATNHVVVSGNIEAHQSVLSFTNVQAPITELPFDEGKAVTAGAVLARVDSRVYQQQLAIDEASLEAAARQVAVATSNLAASRSTVASDRLDFAEKQRDLQRNAGSLRLAPSHARHTTYRKLRQASLAPCWLVMRRSSRLQPTTSLWLRLTSRQRRPRWHSIV